ncbi:putative DNA helicase chromatin remodeling SNF2 family [Lupinus albus]|uniref:Putative DNA helicase chromatin remodeling SNF2 family n=1 Tax=Lupinus albus TaxID=3870 RepID=A0A6A4N2C5_LUPAL|nr:putative DNA helicase chromatin remodeling SNF2 family [Lupinus albus]
MANGTHSSHKGKAEEVNNRRPMQVGEKEKVNPPSNVLDATGLRRSTREASSTKLTTSPSTTRKSERLENKTTPTPAVCRKSQKVEKTNMPSPLRRSGRHKNHSVSTPSDSKSSGSSSSKQKPKKEKTVKQLIFEAKEITENDEHDVGTPQVKVKRMDARMYRATFMKPKRDCLEKPNTTDKSTQEGGTNGGGKIDECCKSSGHVKGLLENNSTLGSLVPSNDTTHETRLAPQSVQPDCNGEEISQMLVSMNVVSDENLVGSNVGLDSGEKMIERKGTTVDKVSNVYSTMSNDNNCTLIGEAGPSRLGGNILGTDRPCSKRRRLDDDSAVPHCNESCNPSTVEEPGWRSSVNKLAQLPGRVSSRFGNNNLLEAVNKLCEHWQKGQSAIVIDDHERILKVVAFIATLQSDIYRPFLIISTAACLHSWANEFDQVDPSIDVAIYNGDKEMRNSIQRFELYDEGGCILFQVLIVVPHILIEDLDVLRGFEWEAIIVDECQSPKISSYFKQIKMLNTHLSVLLFRDQLKDSIEENINILALLDCQSGNEKDGSTSNSSNNIADLKKRLLSHIAYKCQTDFFRFVEYWVPVQISHVQLEQYCGILLSNASILRSSSKVDTAGALRDVLNSTQKCCNHPYVLNPSLQPLLTEGLQTASPEFLDVGCKASGKLQLLDSMLKELRKKKLRALVLFQSIGGSGILVDFLLLRFGQDSYEGIDRSSPLSKKQSAMKKFNNKDNGCFIFLLETIACHSSIKLSSVDAVIIFNSDLNPMNDVRSLQKITLDSQFEFIKIFRLYSSFTIEEKALIFAKQDKTLDINIQNISPSTTHMLLMWGASCLFDDLRVFHDGETSVSSLESLFGGEPHLKAACEFSSILSQDGENNDTSNCSFLLKVQPNGGKYRGNCSLLGEQKLRFLDEEAPHIFWTKLLEGKHFKWKYSCGLSQRSRKKVHHVNGSLDRPDLVSESISKKRRKVSNNTIDQPSSKSGGRKLSAGAKAGTSKNPPGDLADGDPGNGVESEKSSRLHDEQRSLHLLLKPEIVKFCEVLLLPDNVKSTVNNFLGYVINNHCVPREPVSISQAFQISLIWAAASFVKHNLDQNASLILAKEILNFDCKKVEVEYLYSMLRCLKNIFLYRTGISSDTGSPKASESRNGVYSCTGREVELFKKDISKSIKETKKKLKKKLTKLFSMQLEEKQRLKAAIEDEKAHFESKYKLESAAIRCCSPNDVVREEKLEDLSREYAKKIGELKCEHETRLKDLEDVQSAKIRDFQDQEAAWVEELMSWAKSELSNIDALKELGNGVEYLQTCDEALPQKGLKNVDLVSGHFTEGMGHDNMVEVMTGTTIGVPESNSPTLELCSGPVELQTPLVNHIGANGMSIIGSEDPPVSQSEDHNIAENEVIFYSNTSTADEGYGCENFSRGSRDPVDEDLDRELSRPGGPTSPSSGPHDITLSNLPVEHQNPDRVSSCVHDGQFPVEVPETIHEWRTVSVLERVIPAEMLRVVNFTDCPANATPMDNPSENQISIGDSIDVPVLDNVLSSRPSGAASPRGGTLTDPILNQQQILDEFSFNIPHEDIPVIVPENSHAVVDCHNNVEPLTNAGLVHTTSGQREGVPITMTECTLSQDTPVSRSVDAVEPLEQVQQLSSAESPPDQDIAGEMQNSSNQVGLVSSPVDIIPANQFNHASLITSPSESVQQLTSSELPSSNLDPSNIHLLPTIEHQPINEDDVPFHDPEASTIVPNQDAVQPDSNLGLDSHSHQVVMHPAANSNLSSISPGGAGTQPSDTQNLSTPSGISHHNHLIQTATRSASGFVPPLCSEPLKYELERIQQVTEKIKKNHEDMKLQLKSDFEKEYAELRMKYNIKFQEIEVEFQQTKKNLDTSLNAVLMNKILADAFRSKCMVLKQQDAGAAHQLPQHLRQRGATHPSMVAGPSSCPPPAPSLHNPSTTTSPQNVVAPIQPAYKTSGVFSGVPPRPPLINSVSSPLGGSRPPLINSVSSPLGGLQAGGEIRAPAPHLRPYSPSTSVPATTLPAPPRGIPRQPAPSNIPASSAFSHGPPRSRPTTYQSDHHLGRRPDNAGGLPSANLSPVDLPNVRPQMSHDTSLNPSRVRTINSSQEAPDFVYLSDDD